MDLRKHRKKMHNYAGWSRRIGTFRHNRKKMALYMLGWRWPGLE
jgi:hypothetical protein